jgi:hypothetical protein
MHSSVSPPSLAESRPLLEIRHADPFLDDHAAPKDSRPATILAGSIGAGCLLIAVGMIMSKLCGGSPSPTSAAASMPPKTLAEQHQAIRQGVQTTRDTQGQTPSSEKPAAGSSRN